MTPVGERSSDAKPGASTHDASEPACEPGGLKRQASRFQVSLPRPQRWLAVKIGGHIWPDDHIEAPVPVRENRWGIFRLVCSAGMPRATASSLPTVAEKISEHQSRSEKIAGVSSAVSARQVCPVRQQVAYQRWPATSGDGVRQRNLAIDCLRPDAD